MRFIWSNEQPSTCVVTELLWNLLFLDKHPADLVVVFNETPPVATNSRRTKATLQCIKDVFQAIVDIMDLVTFPFAQVKQHNNLKWVVLVIVNSLGSFQNVGQNIFAPLIALLISRNTSANCATSLSHIHSYTSARTCIRHSKRYADYHVYDVKIDHRLEFGDRKGGKGKREAGKREGEMGDGETGEGGTAKKIYIRKNEKFSESGYLYATTPHQ